MTPSMERERQSAEEEEEEEKEDSTHKPTKKTPKQLAPCG